MDAFIDACVSRARAVIVTLFLVVFLGYAAYTSIPKEYAPDIQIPVIYVSMTHEGISPGDAERLLVRPMENELRDVEGVKEMTARASEGSASVTLEFQPGFDSDKALEDVRERVERAKSELPEESDDPIVNEVNFSAFPVVNVILTGDVPERSLVTLAKRLQDEVEAIPNVLQAALAGSREEVVEIEIDPVFVENYGLNQEVAAQITQGFNRLVATGSLVNEQGSFNIKVPGLLETVDDIYSLPLKVDGDAVTELRDIATVKKTYKTPTSFARVNGKQAVVLEVSKRSGTNIIETVDQVKAKVLASKKYWPDDIDVIFAQDQSSRIRGILGELQSNIFLAVFLVTVVVIYFVGVRSALLVAVSIPSAFLIGVLIISFLGFTLNIVVLFSLILSIGMLVDSSIIVCEMANRQINAGVPHTKAYVRAAKYMKWPIVVSTVTTLIVFLPLLFWPGMAGQFMKYMPATLIATLSGSLFVAIIFMPVLGVKFGRSIEGSGEGKISDDEADHAVIEIAKLEGLAAQYAGLLKVVLGRPKRFAASIIGILCLVYVSYAFLGAGVEFFPNVEPDNSQVIVRARGNLSIYEQDALVKKVEQKLEAIDKDVRVFYTRSGNAEGGNRGGAGQTDDTVGTIFLEYEEWDQRRKSADILAQAKASTKDLGGVIVDTLEQKHGPGSIKPIEFNLMSSDLDALYADTGRVVAAMRDIGGFTDIEDTRPVPSIEWRMTIDRALAAQYGADTVSAGNFIKMLTNGLRATTYRPDESDDEVDIVFRFPEQYRSMDMLDVLKVNSSSGTVPISNFMERQAAPKITTINRADSKRVVTIQANVAPGILADQQLQLLKQRFEQDPLSPGVLVKFKGDDEAQNEASSFLRNAFILALIAIALILLVEFNQFRDVFIILSAVFLSTVGVLLGLIITQQPFGIVMCGVGVIALSGVVVNNNIVFIDTFHKFVKQGLNIHDAVVQTGVQRLRPILLTAGTTVLGLMPMVLGMTIDFGERSIAFGAPSSQWWLQLSTTIAGGLAFATILTLFLTPSLLVLGRKSRSD